MLEHQVHDELVVDALAVANVEQADDVGVLVRVEVLEQADLAQGVHRDALVGQRDAHLFQGHVRVVGLVARLVHAAVRTYDLYIL